MQNKAINRKRRLEPSALGRMVAALYCELVPTVLRPRFKRGLASDVLDLVSLHESWLTSNGSNGKRLVLRSADLRGIDFAGRDLRTAELRDCDLRHAIFARRKNGSLVQPSAERSRDSRDDYLVADLSDIDLSYSRLDLATMAVPQLDGTRPRHIEQAVVATGARLVGCSGLYGAQAAYLGDGPYYSPDRAPVLQRWLPGSAHGDFPSWNVHGSMRHLHLLAISNSLAIALVAYASLVAWCNARLERAAEAARSMDAPGWIVEILASLSPLPAPGHFGWLLLVVSCLVAANLIVAIASPGEAALQPTQYSSRFENSGRIQNMAMIYSAPIARWLSFVLLAVPLVYLIEYFVGRVVGAYEIYAPSMLKVVGD